MDLPAGAASPLKELVGLLEEPVVLLEEVVLLQAGAVRGTASTRTRVEARKASMARPYAFDTTVSA